MERFEGESNTAVENSGGGNDRSGADTTVNASYDNYSDIQQSTAEEMNENTAAAGAAAADNGAAAVRERYPTILGASFLYLITLSLMLISSFLFAGWQDEGINYYIFMFVLQFAIIALPALVYMAVNKIPVRKTIRLNAVSVPEFFLTIGMAVFGYFIIIPINAIWYMLLSRIGTPQAPALPPIETGSQFLFALIVIAGVPAAFEEFLFRGVIQRGYERLGLLFSILMTGCLFAMLHLSIVSLPSIILLGIMLCYIVYRSNSILTSIIYHFVNNSIAIVLTFIQGIISKFLPMEGAVESLEALPSEELVAAIIFWCVIGVFALALFGACFAGFHIVTRKRSSILPKEYASSPGKGVRQLIPAIGAGVIVLFLLAMEIVTMVIGL